ncbi:MULTISPECIES: MBL fold metallo-hydrolase [unclassified Rhizobium]|uniref:MBL fold metallo-hydrolase n=1 Tax=unclassified Rhizobium TaxID=2613769 RepID=UPI001608EBF0|nr:MULTISPECIES: MBL fold metallo-hydrolase [unclassified Rhizobium]MBB3385916.1 L-ascorbate metabolism protein UlaG (beta-lactamase superfamily) [Rhizobium sp. BK098]MBB3617621.1 L-ascorbate metabolism protein UlaG (beta-lactamase superfamily) [Rhizobium sp. BK609]MBB3683116.1 L-ascorbate metabolism protein UlaG (beta-lactamase superfamily) [Rhizobium sp. BK612]
MTSSSGSARKNPYYQGPVSDHFDGRRFFNPGGVAPGNALDLLRWQLGGGRVRWPNPVISAFPPAKPDRHVFGEQMRVTMVGHASMLVQVAGLNILTDPVWSERVSPFRSVGPKRVVPPGIRFEDLPHIDLVLVTHNHYDHLDLATLARLQQAHRPKIVTPLGNDTIIRRTVPDADITVVDWGDRVEVRGGVTIDTEPCHHWSARGMGDRRMALWAAFVLTTPAGKIYHVGDTGFHDGINYDAVRQKHGGFRLAILPFGAYEPRWFMKGQHQNPEEAVRGMKLCNAAYAAGHHFATFQLTDEGIDAPVQALDAALKAESVESERFRPLRAGEVFDVPVV